MIAESDRGRAIGVDWAAMPDASPASEPRPTIRPIALGPFETNAYIVTVPGTPECWVVDPGMEPDPLLDLVAREGLKPIAILLTHAHVDHIAGLDDARASFGEPPVYLHRAEENWCSTPMLNLSEFMGLPVSVREPTDWLEGGETLHLAGTTWRVVHTPGHSPGGVCFLHDASGQAIVGDTLFAGSIGRIDFPTSNPAQMRHTILEEMMRWPDDVTVYPGHGPSTTIGRERKTNPYTRGGW